MFNVDVITLLGLRFG